MNIKSLKKSSVVAIALVLITGVAGFYGGIAFQKAQATSVQGSSMTGGPSMMSNGQNSPTQAPGQMQGRAPMPGKILSKDSDSITIELADGSSKIVLLNSNVKINKVSTGTASDLKTGEQVVVFGATNSDGSITASSIQLGDLLAMPGPGMNNATSSAGSASNGSTSSNPATSSQMGNPGPMGAPGGMAPPGMMGAPGGMGDAGAMSGQVAPPSN